MDTLREFSSMVNPIQQITITNEADLKAQWHSLRHGIIEMTMQQISFILGREFLAICNGTLNLPEQPPPLPLQSSAEQKSDYDRQMNRFANFHLAHLQLLSAIEQLLSNTPYSGMLKMHHASLADANIHQSLEFLDQLLNQSSFQEVLSGIHALGTAITPGTSLAAHIANFKMALHKLRKSVPLHQREALNDAAAMAHLHLSLSAPRFRPLFDAYEREIPDQDRTLDSISNFILMHQSLVQRDKNEVNAVTADDLMETQNSAAALKRATPMPATSAPNVVLQLDPKNIVIAEGTTSTTINARSQQGRAQITPTSALKIMYCWTHGVNHTHRSDACQQPKVGHQTKATFENRMNGSNHVTTKLRTLFN